MLTSSQTLNMRGSISSENKRKIPEDVVVEILSKLPAKSVLRFKAVSKLWDSTISNPNNFHGKRCPVNRIFAVVGGLTLHFVSIDEKGSIEKFRAPEWCQLEEGDGGVVISNSCNGFLLLCLGKRIFLVNPCTRYIDRVLTLPESYKYTSCNIEIGFCYDESIGDYKALIFPRSFIRSNTMLVVSLKEKKWTDLRKPTDFGFMLPGPVVNDRLHATNYTGIVSFDPIKDVFEEVVCPNPNSEYGDAIVSLGVLDGCLCMFRRIPEYCRVDGDVECLVMKVYGMAESWITLFVMDTRDRYYGMEPLLRTDIDNIWIKNPNWKSTLISRYNYANKSCTKFIQGDKNNFLYNAVTFIENISSPHTSVRDLV